ncbi:MAG TPA: CRISPR-associated endoribonuclease Cas6 [bacterium]|nr:CRISPR-associated endoribonuclease Cas6 [bacterium]
MRLNITFFSEKEIILPISYNYILQSFIYRNLNTFLSNFLHKDGYIYEKRSFKLFTFSRINGKFRKEQENFIFSPPISFILSSPKEEILECFAETLVKKNIFILNNNFIYIEGVEVQFYPNFSKKEYEIKMLSPVTVYSTLKGENNKKKTYYYSPAEKEFQSLIVENLKKKYFLIYQEETEINNFEITPIDINTSNLKIINYKGTIIKGWMGKFKIKGEGEILKVAYDCGIGSKNPQGFGCFELLLFSEKEVRG